MDTVISLDDTLRVITPEGCIEKVRVIDVKNRIILTEDLDQYKFEDIKLCNLVENKNE